MGEDNTMKESVKAKRSYAAPAVISASQFERRGILAACCQRPVSGAPDCSTVSYEIEAGETAPEQACTNGGGRTAGNTTGTTSST